MAEEETAGRCLPEEEGTGEEEGREVEEETEGEVVTEAVEEKHLLLRLLACFQWVRAPPWLPPSSSWSVVGIAGRMPRWTEI